MPSYIQGPCIDCGGSTWSKVRHAPGTVICRSCALKRLLTPQQAQAVEDRDLQTMLDAARTEDE